jgi:hypothetical protein
LVYREQDDERARLAEQQRKVTAWLAAMEAARGRRVPARRPLGLWLLILVGPLVGAGVAELAAIVCVSADRIAPRVIGGAAGFIAAVVVAYLRASVRQDGLEL